MYKYIYIEFNYKYFKNGYVLKSKVREKSLLREYRQKVKERKINKVQCRYSYEFIMYAHVVHDYNFLLFHV